MQSIDRLGEDARVIDSAQRFAIRFHARRPSASPRRFLGAENRQFRLAHGFALSDQRQYEFRERLDAGRWDVDIAGTRYAARTSLRPLYDPQNAKIKG